MNSTMRSTKQVKTPARRVDSYLEGGRENQKARTRDALVAMATDFLRSGRAISVSDVADAAQISRTTAYRYFPNPELLSAQAALFVAGSIEKQHIDRIASGSGTIEDKLDAIIVGMHDMATAHEAAYRTLLRLSVDASVENMPRRPTFRRRWLEMVLADLKKELGAARVTRLVGALSLLCGIETVVVLHDICAMPSKEALEVKRWAARQLLRAAREEATPAKAKPRKSR
ncbi:MAG TPA: TetR/AcrR family transcriptional regulator [Beijerinckiaceae bacterium]|nr:TetR/AcrR family transcriptional regulator [Beijerinckiaceae bacterium]